MGTLRSLHIGLNGVDPNRYTEDGVPWPGTLHGCEADARAMQTIALDHAASPSDANLLLTDQATVDAVLNGIARLATSSQPGDLAVITYSGHGSTAVDEGPDEDESDHQDETWCLYDGELVDDRIYQSLRAFDAGVRVLSFSDSCHSGTVLRLVPDGRSVVKKRSAHATKLAKGADANGAHHRQSRWADPRHVRSNRLERSTVRSSPDSGRAACAILHFAACTDFETAGEVDGHGVFTAALVEKLPVANTYNELADLLQDAVRGQTPSYTKFGRDDPAFRLEKPFTV